MLKYTLRDIFASMSFWIDSKSCRTEGSVRWLSTVQESRCYHYCQWIFISLLFLEDMHTSHAIHIHPKQKTSSSIPRFVVFLHAFERTLFRRGGISLRGLTTPDIWTRAQTSIMAKIERKLLCFRKRWFVTYIYKYQWRGKASIGRLPPNKVGEIRTILFCNFNYLNSASGYPN